MKDSLGCLDLNLVQEQVAHSAMSKSLVGKSIEFEKPENGINNHKKPAAFVMRGSSVAFQLSACFVFPFKISGVRYLNVSADS